MQHRQVWRLDARSLLTPLTPLHLRASRIVPGGSCWGGGAAELPTGGFGVTIAVPPSSLRSAADRFTGQSIPQSGGGKGDGACGGIGPRYNRSQPVQAQPQCLSRPFERSLLSARCSGIRDADGDDVRAAASRIPSSRERCTRRPNRSRRRAVVPSRSLATSARSHRSRKPSRRRSSVSEGSTYASTTPRRSTCPRRTSPDAVAVDDADVGERAAVVDVDQSGHGARSGLGVIDVTDGRTARHGARRTRNPPGLGWRAPLPGAAR